MKREMRKMVGMKGMFSNGKMMAIMAFK